MGFGGGGSGSFVLPDHAHSSVLEDGGELERLVTKVDLDTLENFHKQGNLTLLYSETLALVGTSMTYTPSTPLSQNDYDYFLVELDGKSGGVGAYQMRINTADTQNYYYAGRRISDVPTETLIGGQALAYQRIGYAGAYISNDICVAEIWFEDGNDMPIINSWGWVGQSQIEERIIGQNNHANSFSTLINLEVSHSAAAKLRDGSIFRVWGVNKAT